METCNLEPFRYGSVPQPMLEEGASSTQVNDQQVEAWLERLRASVCNDLMKLDARVQALETP